MYIIGPNDSRVHILKVNGITKNWKWNEKLMEFFSTLELFGLWNWVNNKSALLYFDDEKQLKDAENLMGKEYPNTCMGESNPID